MPEKDIEDLLMGKKIKNKKGFHKLLMELGTQGRVFNVHQYVDIPIMKKTWCWGYTTLTGLDEPDGFSVSNDDRVIELDVEPYHHKQRVRFISRWVEVIPKRPPKFLKVASVSVRLCLDPIATL